MLKMNENLKYFGNIDVEPIKEKIINASWNNEYSSIRKIFDSHNCVDVLPLMWSLKNLSESYEIQADKTEFYDEFYDIIFFSKLKKILKDNLGNGYFIRILFTKLLANSEIPPHFDGGESLIKNHRVHIPIQTNSNVSFSVHNETINMKEGNIWEINNERAHGVINASSEDRIHLIVDWHVVK
jgi:hypothetical protein